ncbi:MAG: hypothetical protein ACI8PT_000801, partial [Gammaproteobacteria bacterium]
AAAAQSKSLGLTPGICWVAHPIQNKTALELEALTADALERILALIERPNTGVDETRPPA